MKTINLPAVFDRMVAIELAPEIADALGGGPGVTIAAGDVRQIGQCGVQLLLSAALTASRRGLAFVIQDASEARSEERRVGKDWCRTCSSRLRPYHSTQKKNKLNH